MSISLFRQQIRVFYHIPIVNPVPNPTIHKSVGLRCKHGGRGYRDARKKNLFYDEKIAFFDLGVMGTPKTFKTFLGVSPKI